LVGWLVGWLVGFRTMALLWERSSRKLVAVFICGSVCSLYFLASLCTSPVVASVCGLQWSTTFVGSSVRAFVLRHWD